MIDTHAHLDFKDYDEDREEVISRAFDNGPARIASRDEAGRVKAIINVGVDLERSRRSVEIAKVHKNVFASVGLHPEYFMNYESGIKNYEKGLEDLKNLAKSERVVAIGECGLDYYHAAHSTQHATQDLGKIKMHQKDGFVAQIEIAYELGLPVIVHCREAWDDVYDIVKAQSTEVQITKQNTKRKTRNTKNYQSSAFPFRELSSRNSSKPSFSKFVLHCYSGGKEDTKKFLKLPSVFFSFSGNITYPKPIERAEKLATVIRMIPLDRIMLDSDSPFLAPQEYRGKRNEPIFVKYIAQKIASIKEIGFAEVEKVTDENAVKFFNLGNLEG
ncbi:MAG: TatD family hydrolase [Parcubacteria group bacterium]|jgi:TatD DNase family protein